MNTVKHETLCWGCENAGGKCSWSSGFIPVEGWKAEPTKIKSDYHSKDRFFDSYDVYECPEFEPLQRMNAQKVENATRAMMTQGGKSIESMMRKKYNSKYREGKKSKRREGKK